MRNYGLIRWLSERNRISLLSFGEPDQIGASGELVRGAAEPLRSLCQRVELVPLPPVRTLMRRGLDTFTHRLPDMALRLASSAYAERLVDWLARESFDIVHIEGIEMAPYLDLVLGARPKSEIGRAPGDKSPPGPRRPMVIFDDHNCEYMLQRSYAIVDARNPRRWAGAIYSFIQWQKLRRYEADVCRRAHHILAVSQTDAEALSRIVPDLSITVIPNGIDTEEYESPTVQGRHQNTGSDPTLVFTGKMDFRPNVDAVGWFAEAIWPRIRAEVPDAQFLAVGQRPHPKLERLCKDPSITLTGWVEEIRPYIDQATIYVAPLRMGSGTRLKLLQAMASGKAIVSTRIGAEGLAGASREYPTASPKGSSYTSDTAVSNQELILVNDDDPIAFADAVVRLLREPELRSALGAAARTFVRAHYDWRVIIPRLEEVYAQRQ